jgi:hypothetical protein
MDREPNSTADVARRILSETLVPLPKLAVELDLDPVTPGRWCDPGVITKGDDGSKTRVKLDHIKLGGRVYTSREALVRFVGATTRPAPPEAETTTPAPRRRTARERAEASRRAGEVLASLGC